MRFSSVQSQYLNRTCTPAVMARCRVSTVYKIFSSWLLMRPDTKTVRASSSCCQRLVNCPSFSMRALLLRAVMNLLVYTASTKSFSSASSKGVSAM